MEPQSPLQVLTSNYFPQCNNDSLYHFLGFPGGLDGKESACSAGDLGSIPGSGRSPGEGNSNPLQYSCLENPVDGGVWSATVHGIAKAQLSDFSFFLSLSLPTPLTPVSIYLPIYHLFYLSSISLSTYLSFIYYLCLTINYLSMYLSIGLSGTSYILSSDWKRIQTLCGANF